MQKKNRRAKQIVSCTLQINIHVLSIIIRQYLSLWLDKYTNCSLPVFRASRPRFGSRYSSSIVL